VEEILFRGFLLERFQDATYLFSRVFSRYMPLSSEKQFTIANCAQSIIFGLAHIWGKEVDPIYGMICVYDTSRFGYYVGHLKKSIGNSLVLGTLMHAVHNAFVIMRYPFTKGF
jgi:membrane protease YdiL (CAAX protease family)